MCTLCCLCTTAAAICCCQAPAGSWFSGRYACGTGEFFRYAWGLAAESQPLSNLLLAPMGLTLVLVLLLSLMDVPNVTCRPRHPSCSQSRHVTWTQTVLQRIHRRHNNLSSLFHHLGAMVEGALPAAQQQRGGQGSSLSNDCQLHRSLMCHGKNYNISMYCHLSESTCNGQYQDSGLLWTSNHGCSELSIACVARLVDMT